MKRYSDTTDKIHILVYEASSGFGGSANALVGLLDNLDREKFHLIAVIKNSGSQIDKIKNTEIIRSKWPELIRLYSIIKRRKIDIVHVNNNIIAGIPAIIAAKIAGVPCICHIRQTRKLIKREKFFANFVDCFILINKDAYDVYNKDIPAEKLYMVHDGIDLREFAPLVRGGFRKEYKLNGSPLIGLVGRIIKGKGHKEFVMASKKVLKVKPDTKFVIAGSAKGGGDEYYKEVRSLVKSEELDNNIIFTGWRDDIVSVISDLDVLIQATTTYPEGFGLTIIEAMALEKPVVATNIPGPADIVVDGETGFLIPPQDPDLLASAIIRLLDKQDLARQMGINGRRRVEEMFDIRKNVKKIEGIYEQILSA